jgi:hypothetical protein
MPGKRTDTELLDETKLGYAPGRDRRPRFPRGSFARYVCFRGYDGRSSGFVPLWFY